MLKVMLSAPLLGFLFAAGGAGLAWLWFEGQGYAAALIIAILILSGYLFGKFAQASLPAKPVRAVQLMEGQVLAIAALTAAAAATAIVIAIAFVPADVSDSATEEVKQAAAQSKAVMTTLATALAGFVTSLAVKAEDIDTTIGSRVKAMFYDAYPGENPTTDALNSIAANQRVRHTVSAGSAAEAAVYSDGAIPDWNRENRLLRATRLQQALEAESVSDTSA